MAARRTLMALGTLPSNGSIITPAKTWDLSKLPGWVPRGRWHVIEVGWVPLDTDVAVFSLSASGVSTETIMITPGVRDNARRMRWPIPDGWDGRLTWTPGGKSFDASEALTEVNWNNTFGAPVWVVLELEEPAQSEAGCR